MAVPSCSAFSMGLRGNGSSPSSFEGFEGCSAPCCSAGAACCSAGAACCAKAIGDDIAVNPRTKPKMPTAEKIRWGKAEHSFIPNSLCFRKSQVFLTFILHKTSTAAYPGVSAAAPIYAQHKSGLLPRTHLKRSFRLLQYCLARLGCARSQPLRPRPPKTANETL